MENKKDLKEVFRLFIPILIELFLITLLSSVDTIMLSRYDELCVDAVGTSSTALNMLTILIIIASNGVGIVVGQLLGGKEYEKAKRVLSQGVFFNIILGAILFLTFFFGNGAILKLANTPDSFIDYAKTYLKIYAIALPFMAVTQVINANFRAYGKPLYMTIVSIASNLLNILLNWLLIFGVGKIPELGIAGAAIATAISLMFKTVCGLVLNHFILKCHIIPRKIDRSIMLAIIKIGAPSALESTFYCVANFILIAALNTLPEANITARVYIFLTIAYVKMFGDALGSANGVIVAKHIGAREYSEAKSITIKVAIIGFAISTFMISMLIILARPIFTAIAGSDELVPLIKSVLPLFYILEGGQCLNLIVIGAEKAAGDVIFPLILGIICMMLVHAGGAWLFTAGFHWGLAGIILAQALDELFRATISIARWFSNKWKNHSLIEEETKSEALA